MKKRPRKLKRVAKQQAKNYVDNKAFLAALIEYKKEVNLAKQNGTAIPKIPEYIGQCFLDIAKNLSYKGNFINYTFREDFISDGVENCVQYILNFDPEKHEKPNPFAYFTQIILYAFIRRIKKEKKQMYIKYKTMENYKLMEEYIECDSKTGAYLPANQREFIKQFEDSISKKKK